MLVLAISQCNLPIHETGDAEGTTPLRMTPPLDTMVPTGSLGEYRPGGLHFGLDLSTGGKTGAPVLAAAEGYISRIKYGRYGIGLGVWIVHSDETQTLYGHLSALEDRVIERINDSDLERHLEERTEFDLYLTPGSVTVNLGEQIGLSGETGYGFPHLHFEIHRRGQALDPLLVLDLPDDTAPILQTITLIPHSSGASINGEINSQTFPIKVVEEDPPEDSSASASQVIVHYRLQASAPVRVHGRARVQLDAFDPSSRSRLGLYSAQLFVEGSEHFWFQIDSLPRRFAREHLLLYDLRHSRIGGSTTYRYNLFEKIPGHVNWMRGEDGGWVGPIPPNAKRSIRIVARDRRGNESRLAFDLTGGSEPSDLPRIQEANVRRGERTILRSNDTRFEVEIPPGSLYEDKHFEISENQPRPQAGLRPLSPAYSIRPTYLDFLQAYTASIAAPLSSRAHVYTVGYRSRALASPVSHRDGQYYFDALHTGTFAVMEDWKAPRWKTIRYNRYRDGSRLLIFPQDDESGIELDSLTIRVDGKPVLWEHEPDYGAIDVFAPEGIFEPGRHVLHARISDRAENQSELFQYVYYVLN